DVILEYTLKACPERSRRVGGATKAPDYCFRIGGMRKFFVEAKKPSVNIAADPGPAFQLRRYAWSANWFLVSGSWFQEPTTKNQELAAVYDCRSRPARTDKASTARIKLLRYSEYPDRWDELSSVFSPEAISKGKVESKEGEMSKSGHLSFPLSPSPNAFLAGIEGWRDSLARNSLAAG
ncbi:MAG: hypothetical protein NTX53_18935, partial [candidate division WOR-3 bacterium]|nr:hypothetical protein [candidate division WOR-3 bacterium]